MCHIVDLTLSLYTTVYMYSQFQGFIIMVGTQLHSNYMKKLKEVNSKQSKTIFSFVLMVLEFLLSEFIFALNVCRERISSSVIHRALVSDLNTYFT